MCVDLVRRASARRLSVARTAWRRSAARAAALSALAPGSYNSHTSRPLSPVLHQATLAHTVHARHFAAVRAACVFMSGARRACVPACQNHACPLLAQDKMACSNVAIYNHFSYLVFACTVCFGALGRTIEPCAGASRTCTISTPFLHDGNDIIVIDNATIVVVVTARMRVCRRPQW